MLHSKTAKFSAAQAALTERTARISSTVSITTMGVEESIRIFSRSAMSLIQIDWIFSAGPYDVLSVGKLPTMQRSKK
jgi:hypothetical protein